MKKNLFFVLCVLNVCFVGAQTWNGSVGTDWNTALNWTPNAVPTSTGAVVIPVPGVITNWPVLPGNITIGRFTMNAGSQLNTNGFNLISTGTNSFNLTGATITNPVAANTSDFTIPAVQSAINGCTFNGNFSFQKSSNGQSFNEANSTANTWNGNLTITLGLKEGISLSGVAASAYNGNVTVIRLNEDIGLHYFFLAGGVTIAGNFSYTNPIGGSFLIGSSVNGDTRILGTVNINIQNPGTTTVYRVKNKTQGGSIIIDNNTSNSNFLADSLLVNTFSFSTSTGQLSIDSNYITGIATIASTGTTYLNKNTFTGDLTVTKTAGVLYESYTKANTYLGNVSITTSSTTVIGYSDTSTFYKSLTINTSNLTGLNLRLAGSTDGIFTQLGTQNPVPVDNIIMQKTDGAKLTLNTPIIVSKKIFFNSGYLYTSNTNYVKFNDATAVFNASNASHVVGYIQMQIGVHTPNTRTFPLGNGHNYFPINKLNIANSVQDFTATFIPQNATSYGYIDKGNTLNNISNVGFWEITGVTDFTTPQVGLGFSKNPYESYTNLAGLKLANWYLANWKDNSPTFTTGADTLGALYNSNGLTYGQTLLGRYVLFNATSTYFYKYSNPGAGPDGTPVKISAVGGYPGYITKQLPSGSYSTDSIYLLPNATAASFKLEDVYGVEKDDTTITAPTAPTFYISANGSGTKSFTGWRHFVYLTNASNEIIGAIKDNNLTLGNTTMTAYFSTANVATAPNGNIYLKRSFKITSQFAPAGTRRVRFYITKTEFNNLQAADPASFPNGVNSITITKYSGPQEDSLFNPIPGGNTIIIPNSDITIADLGTMYSLDIDVTGFSGFYIGGNQSNASLCSGSSISIPSDITGSTYQWQVDNGTGYVNITNNAVYNGATTNTLTLTNVPPAYYGYKLRCALNGGVYSQVYTLKFTATWLGTANTVWENAANWSCGILPDANTDILVNNGRLNYPEAASNIIIRSLKVGPGASVTAKTGANLTILK